PSNPCKKKAVSPSIPTEIISSPMEEQSILNRPADKLKHRAISLDQLNDSISNSFQSLGDISNDLDIVNDLKQKNIDLKLNLQSCEQELDSKIIENNNLNRQIDKLTQEINLLRNICKTPQRSKRAINSTPSPGLQKHDEQIKALSNTITQLQQDLQSAKIEISKLNKHIAKLEQIDNLQLKNITQPLPDGRLTKSHNKTNIKNKLCIISNNNRHKMLQNVQRESNLDDYQVCHYIIQNASITSMLKDLKLKLVNFNKSDYCLILVGETDFYNSQDVSQLVASIKDSLTQIVNTNIILMTPTYICGKPLFNYNVEIFNNQLNQDIVEHNYAYLIDSNANLTYDMFSIMTGKVTRKGIQNILHNAAELMYNIQLNRSEIEVEKPTENEFFLV
ncbi:hypothetical protein ACJJTC_009431, partial [Scirpophaga incertulas]